MAKNTINKAGQLEEKNENIDQTTIPAQKENSFISVARSLPTWDFDQNPIFQGVYINTETLGKNSEKPFTAHCFADSETGEMCYISDYHTVTESINEVSQKFGGVEIEYRIEFLGKTTVKGKPFRRFSIGYRLV